MVVENQFRRLAKLPVKILIRGLRFLVGLTTEGFETRAHIWRFSMYQSLSNLNLAEQLGTDAKALAISGSVQLGKLLGFDAGQIIEANYPEYNVLALKLQDSSFDCVLADQVLEHVAGDPGRAISECFRVLKPGGYLIHTTCFVQEIHWGPEDFWRFTPDSLEYLCEAHSDNIVATGWGSRIALIYMWLGLRFVKIPVCKLQPLNAITRYNEAKMATRHVGYCAEKAITGSVNSEMFCGLTA